MTKFKATVASVLSMATFIASPVAADGAWQPFEESWTGFRGGQSCAPGPDQIGGSACLLIGCTPGELGYIRITLDALVSLPLQLNIELQNGDASLMRETFFLHTDESGEMQGDYWAALPAEWGGDVVALLGQGRSGSMILDLPSELGGTVTVPVDLAGADTALEPAMSCTIRPLGAPDPMAFNG